MSVRLDKWLQVARMYKTRTKATTACELGRVKVNGQPAKPHRQLAPGDRVELLQGDWERVLIVKELRDKPVAKAAAAALYDDQSPPRPAPDPLARLMRRPPALRDAGAGRPTKKERRDMERWSEGEPSGPEEPDDLAEDDDEED
jgi:ribosome-associated heat shock protein Hsp15